MNKLKSHWQRWYADFERRALATQSAPERDDALAFERWCRVNKWSILSVFSAIVTVVTLGLMLLRPRVSIFEAALLASIMLLAVGVGLLSAWFGPRTAVSRQFEGGKTWDLLVILASVVAMSGGLGVGVLLRGWSGISEDFVRLGGPLLGAALLFGGGYAAAVIFIMHIRRRQFELLNLTLKEQAHRELLARQLTDSRLKLMQAQVEPHFLFNTLASVQDLAEGRAPEAAALTAQLIAFLRAGLASLRDERTTLRREFAMASAYLEIMQLRIGDRLRFRLDLPAELADVAMPPAMLISLVENAIKHGIEPAVDGGEIVVAAAIDESGIELRVADSGAGLAAAKRGRASGVGLRNIDERLAAIYGEAASLMTAAESPRGFVAVLRLPREIATETTPSPSA